MTGNLSQTRRHQLTNSLLELEHELAGMQPLLRQMHLLSANAVSAAARAGSEGDAFRVLTQAIQQLGQEINQSLQQAQALLQQAMEKADPATAQCLIRQVDDVLAAMPLSVRKGEYLAICSAVESAHTTDYGDSFNAVANMLKDLVNRLRQCVSSQQTVLERLRTDV